MNCLESGTQPSSSSTVSNDASWLPREFDMPMGSAEQSDNKQHWALVCSSSASPEGHKRQLTVVFLDPGTVNGARLPMPGRSALL
jgi:hypothetical protein